MNILSHPNEGRISYIFNIFTPSNPPLVFAGISSIMKLYLPEEVTVTGKHLFPPPANTRYPEAPYGDTFMAIWPDKRKEFP